jgi:hypothetical protein
MDNGYWIKQAHKYICEHHAFSEVSDIAFMENESIISASVSINLPSKFIETGVTNKGIRSKEDIKFIFYDDFPLGAPKIVLRNDFPRNFPHVNPSKDEVLPCIYAGNLSELLQQPQWMNGILDQLVNWLENAASNSLLNQKQGWEPMRNDDFRGFIVYNDYAPLENLNKNANASGKYRAVQYSENQKFVFAGDQFLFDKGKNAQHLFFITPKIVDCYIPNPIKTLSDLYVYAGLIGLPNIKTSIEDIDTKFYDEEKIFVSFLIKRPCKIIGSDFEIEFLNFLINKGKKRKGKKRVLSECIVEMLAHINDKSTSLLQKLSGTVNAYKDNNR